jgi:FAD/FMN-containing dehydrogenase
MWPPSIDESPAIECPPPRIARTMPCSRAKLTASTTSAVPTQLTIRSGPLSCIAFEDFPDVAVAGIARGHHRPADLGITGVAGLTLGGGYGWVRRKYGLSSDSLLEAQVVCADGQVRTASAEENPDLYWRFAAGAATSASVTAFRFKLHPLGPIVGFVGAVYPIEDVAHVLRGWRSYVSEAPDEVTSVCVTITFPAAPDFPEVVHDRAVAVVGGVYVGDPDEGMKAMQPLRGLGTLLMDMSQPMPFTAVQTAFDPFLPAEHAQGVLEVAVPRRAVRRGDRGDRRSSTGPAGAAHPREHVPHGRSDHEGRS